MPWTLESALEWQLRTAAMAVEIQRCRIPAAIMDGEQLFAERSVVSVQQLSIVVA